jgi:hypothetical protein
MLVLVGIAGSGVQAAAVVVSQVGATCFTRTGNAAYRFKLHIRRRIWLESERTAATRQVRFYSSRRRRDQDNLASILRRDNGLVQENRSITRLSLLVSVSYVFPLGRISIRTNQKSRPKE